MLKCFGYFSGALPCSARLAVLFALLSCVLSARAQARNERDLKCLFFVTLARYTEWPSNAFANPTSPVVLGVIGEDPFGSVLEAMTKNETVRNRPIRLLSVATVDQMGPCHMLYFGRMSTLRRELELSRLAGRPVLTVSDVPGFARGGGMVELFVNDERKVRLRVSKSALERAQVQLSPSILKLATEVAIFEWDPLAPDPWFTIRHASRPSLALAFHSPHSTPISLDLPLAPLPFQ